MDGDGGGYKTIPARWPERELFFGLMGLRLISRRYYFVYVSCYMAAGPSGRSREGFP
jgi:hypothetical protein